jgi:hypothetical protein
MMLVKYLLENWILATKLHVLGEETAALKAWHSFLQLLSLL